MSREDDIAELRDFLGETDIIEENFRHSVKEALLAKILKTENTTKEFDLLLQRGLCFEHFSGPQRELFGFIKDYRIEYGVVPSGETLERQRPVLYSLVEPVPVFAAPIQGLYDELITESIREDISAFGNELYTKLTSDTKGMDMISFLFNYVGELGNKYYSRMQGSVTFDKLGDDLEADYFKTENGVTRGPPIPFPFLQDMLGGWEPSQLSTIVARTGVGKTWALILAADAIIHGDPFRYNLPIGKQPWDDDQKYVNRGRVLFASNEMSALDIGRRCAAIFTKTSFNRLRAGKLLPDEKKKYLDYVRSLKTNEPAADYGKAFKLLGPEHAGTPDQIFTQAQDFKADIVIIDGFYLMDGPGNERWQKVQHNIRQMRLHTLRSNMHYILSSQFTAEARSVASSGIDKLSFSASIGHDSSNVIALVQNSAQKAAQKVAMMSIKARDGEVGKAWEYLWDFVNMRFAEIGELRETGSGGGMNDAY